MTGITLIICIAVLLEALVSYAKALLKMFEEGERKAAIIQSITIVAGIGFAFLFALNIFEPLQIAVSATAGKIITGILISRGSNFVNEIYQKLRGENPEISYEDFDKFYEIWDEEDTDEDVK